MAGFLGRRNTIFSISMFAKFPRSVIGVAAKHSVFATPRICLELLSWHRSRMVDGLIGSTRVFVRVLWHEAFLLWVVSNCGALDVSLKTRAA